MIGIFARSVQAVRRAGEDHTSRVGHSNPQARAEQWRCCCAVLISHSSIKTTLVCFGFLDSLHTVASGRTIQTVWMRSVRYLGSHAGYHFLDVSVYEPMAVLWSPSSRMHTRVADRPSSKSFTNHQIFSLYLLQKINVCPSIRTRQHKFELE